MTITEWFANEGTYQEGVMLLMELGAPRSLLNVLQRKMGCRPVPEFYMNKLRYELAKHLPKGETPPEPTQPKTVAAATVVTNEVVQALRQKARRLHKLHDKVHADMRAATTDEQRFLCAQRIMEDILPALDEIYDRIRAYESGREEPNPADVFGYTRKQVGEMIRRYQSLKTLISRTRKRIEQSEGTEREQCEVQLAGYEVEFAELRSKLGLDGNL